jgi:hypothetical protein
MQAHALWRQVAHGAFDLGAVGSDKYRCVFENALTALRSSFSRGMHLRVTHKSPTIELK